MLMNHRLASSLHAYLPVLVGLVFWTGCGEKTPFQIVPVSGRVTYEDGAPIPGPPLLIRFLPQAEPVSQREYPRPASGLANAASGAFDCLTTVRYGDGATVGPNKVLVESLNEARRPTGAVPLDYADSAKTPLLVEVAAGHGPYEIKIPKPRPTGVGLR